MERVRSTRQHGDTLPPFRGEMYACSGQRADHCSWSRVQAKLLFVAGGLVWAVGRGLALALDDREERGLGAYMPLGDHLPRCDQLKAGGGRKDRTQTQSSSTR